MPFSLCPPTRSSRSFQRLGKCILPYGNLDARARGISVLVLKTDQTIGMHERVIQEFKRGELEPRVICECSSVAIIVALVAEGIGATILPESVMSSFTIPNIRTLSITSADFQSDVGIVWLRIMYYPIGLCILATFIE